MVNKSKNIDVIETIKPKIIKGFDLMFSSLLDKLLFDNKLLSIFLLKRLRKGLVTIRFRLIALVF